MDLEAWANVAKIVGALTGLSAAVTWVVNRARRPWSTEEQTFVWLNEITHQGQKARVKGRKKKPGESRRDHRARLRKAVGVDAWAKRQWRGARLAVTNRRSKWAKGTILSEYEDAAQYGVGRCRLCPPRGAFVAHPPERFWVKGDDWNRGGWAHNHYFPGESVVEPSKYGV